MTASTAARTALGPTRLVGRSAELDRLGALLADRAGAGLVLRGEPGVGTSELLAAAAAEAGRAGFRVLSTAAVAGRPYGSLDRLAPTDPILLAVDDLQELDGGSRARLAAAAAAGRSIVVLGATRAGGPGLPGVPELVVGPLDDGPSRLLLDRHAADLHRPVRERLAVEARGNPLALVELPVAWRESARPGDDVLLPAPPVTARLARAFAGPVAELPPATRTAMLVAAIGPGCAPHEVTGAVSLLLGRWAGTDVLQPAVTAGVVTVLGDALAFRHPLVGAAVLGSTPLIETTRAAAALATVLSGQPYRQVWHQGQSCPAPASDVAAELQLSAAEAVRRGQPVEAVRRVHRAAQLSPDPADRAERLMLAAQHALELGRPDLARRLSGDAECCAPPPAARARQLCLAYSYGGPGPSTVGELVELCATADQHPDTDLALELLVTAATAAWWTDPGQAVRDRIEMSVGRADSAGADPRAVAVTALCRGRLEASPGRAGGLLGLAAYAAGDPVRSMDLLIAAADELRGQGRRGLLAQVLGAQARAAVALTDGHRAGAAAAECRELALATGQPAWATYGLAAGAVAAALRGDADEARATAVAAERSAAGRPAGAVLAAVRLARGLAWLGTGHPGEAYAMLRPLFRPEDPSYDRRELAGALGFLAEAAGGAGQRTDALAVVERLDASSPALAVAVRHARAVLADDESLLLAALDADLVRWPFARARLELVHGSRLRRRRRVTESRVLLRSAADTFDLVAAGPWAARARTELRAAGLAGLPVPGRAPLSAQELEVARLAVEGLSNREIGQRLHLSPRTVGSHLYRMYPKLGVTGRTQLAARLGTPVG
jgi:DNA-binding CsgD family transcriptional regulator